jgi:hypothetical protein
LRPPESTKGEEAMSMKTELPIIFRGDMVNAIIEGRKKQTRRKISFNDVPVTEAPYLNTYFYQPKYLKKYNGYDVITLDELLLKCPYGKAGDELWVKETWKLWQPGPGPVDIVTKPLSHLSMDCLMRCHVEYKAETNNEGPWRSSLYMPKWASRLRLQKKEVRVERLQDITEEDAKAEGVTLNPEIKGDTYKKAFARLWAEIHGDKSWEKNPLLWVITWN